MKFKLSHSSKLGFTLSTEGNLKIIVNKDINLWGARDGAVVRAMRPGLDSRTRRHMWVEFVVGSLLCSEMFTSGYCGYPFFSKTNISKFQFDLGMHGHF